MFVEPYIVIFMIYGEFVGTCLFVFQNILSLVRLTALIPIFKLLQLSTSQHYNVFRCD